MILKKILEWLRSKYNDVFFLGATDVLPAPLSKEDELMYLKRVQTGDIEARNVLIEHNLRLVVFLAKKFDNSGYELEDLVSIGSLGLIKGIMTYKIDKNIKLATYASRCITNEILMYIRKNKKRKGEISLEDALSYDAEGNELHLEDIMGSGEDVVHEELEKKLSKEELIREIQLLPERDQEIISLRYGLNGKDEYTQKEVAELLGISQSYISRIEKKVIKKLQTSMHISLN